MATPKKKKRSDMLVGIASVGKNGRVRTRYVVDVEKEFGTGRRGYNGFCKAFCLAVLK